jgi:hypothetical protein
MAVTAKRLLVLKRIDVFLSAQHGATGTGCKPVVTDFFGYLRNPETWRSYFLKLLGLFWGALV